MVKALSTPTNRIHWHLSVALVWISLIGLGMGLAPRSLAADPLSAQPSPIELNVPSLWWARDQFEAKDEDSRKLIQQWTVSEGKNGEPGQVTYRVNRQLWTLLDYVERYTFLNDFGSAASEFGYNIVVYPGGNQEAAALGSYVCNHDALALTRLPAAKALRSLGFNAKMETAAPVASSTRPCQILLESGKDSLRGRSSPFDVDGAKPIDTD